MRWTRGFGLVGAIAVLVAASGCAALPWPDPADGPAVAWIDSPDAAQIHYVEVPGIVIGLVSNPTVPSFITVDGVTEPVDGLFATHYQGSGLAIRIPEDCQDQSIAGRPVHVEVNGTGQDYTGDPGWASYISAVYVTVSGAGEITAADVSNNGVKLRQTWPTMHVAPSAAYVVRVSCSVPDPDPSKPAVTLTYERTLLHSS
jgi:hypothetical protein